VVQARPLSRHLAALVALALVVRLVSLLGTIDEPGDGPTRASAAYEWAQNPALVTHGFWPPGFLYLSGLATMLFPRPLYTARLVNLLLGTATVPLAFLAVRRIYGSSIGFTTAFIVALMPLHVHLSASSLTEASALFELLAGLYALQISTAARGPAQFVYLAISGVFLSLASMTRYEIWLLLPLLTFYHWQVTRRRNVTTLFAVALAAFPVAWMVGNHVVEGNALLGLAFAVAEQSGSGRGELPGAIATIVRHFVAALGPLFPVALVLGVAFEIALVVRRDASAARVLWLAIVLLINGALLVFGLTRGESLWNRYLLLAFVLSAPIALVPVGRFLRSPTATGLWLKSALLVALTVSLGAAAGSYDPRLFYSAPWLTADRPAEIVRLADWLAESPWKDDPVLISRMDWRSTYLALYYPPVSSRKFIFSEWTPDETIRAWDRLVRPTLFITARSDDAYLRRFETILGAPFERADQVYAADDILVFHIRRPTNAPAR